MTQLETVKGMLAGCCEVFDGEHFLLLTARGTRFVFDKITQELIASHVPQLPACYKEQ
jgi:hypothetical protein